MSRESPSSFMKGFDKQAAAFNEERDRKRLKKLGFDKQAAAFNKEQDRKRLKELEGEAVKLREKFCSGNEKDNRVAQSTTAVEPAAGAASTGAMVVDTSQSLLQSFMRQFLGGSPLLLAAAGAASAGAMVVDTSQSLLQSSMRQFLGGSPLLLRMWSSLILRHPSDGQRSGTGGEGVAVASR